MGTAITFFGTIYINFLLNINNLINKKINKIINNINNYKYILFLYYIYIIVKYIHINKIYKLHFEIHVA